ARQPYIPLARKPPSTGKTTPVMNRADSEARKMAAPCISSSVPNRPIGVRSRILFPLSEFPTSFSFMGVTKTPGAIAFTRIPKGAHSAGQTCSQLIHGSLAAAVNRGFCEVGKGRHRAQVDDGSSPLIPHHCGNPLANKEGRLQI